MSTTFHDVYVVKPGDTLARIAQGHGLPNPGPIVAYPPGAASWRGRSPNLIRPGERLLIPWAPELLKKVIATSEHLIGEIGRSAAALIREQYHDKKQLEEFLFKIDAANFLAGVGVGIGGLTAQGLKGAEMSSKEALVWLVESRASLASNLTTFSVPAPDAPKTDIRFFVRHALGPWNPSYWASVWTAIQEKDLDLYLYGADATAHKTSMRIKQQADADVARLTAKISDARQQLGMPFYRHRV